MVWYAGPVGTCILGIVPLPLGCPNIFQEPLRRVYNQHSICARIAAVAPVPLPTK